MRMIAIRTRTVTTLWAHIHANVNQVTKETEALAQVRLKKTF